ncbi:unnamed protein product [Caenorhabditis sp. 36 PRJEB53466]|nr:unnamed protein product [Caenorhabditis sp. 36 PRJEB53466]
MAHSLLGFICEVGEKSYKIYDYDKGVCELPLHNGDEFERGKFYTVSLEGKLLCPFHPDLNLIDLFEKDGNLMAKTVAVGFPILLYDEMEEICDKYELCVWSPFLRMLRDPDHQFYRENPDVTPIEVTCKYAPGDDGRVFEIVDMACLRKEWQLFDIVYAAPWNQEAFDLKQAELCSLPDDSERLPSNQKLPLKKESSYIGFVCAVDVRNTTKSAKNDFPTCALVYSSMIGILRCMAPNLHVGDWCYFGVIDDRWTKTRDHKNSWHYREARAIDLQAMHPDNVPVPTEVIDGKVEFTCSFVYRPDNFETPENRKIEDMEVRSSNFSKTAHFYDSELWKIEIYPYTIRQMVEAIEYHWKELKVRRREEYELLKKEKLRVTVKVRMLENAQSKFVPNKNGELKTDESVFVVNSIHKIAYDFGGENIIWKEQEEEGLTEAVKRLEVSE